jgi:hypothetical protein
MGQFGLVNGASASKIVIHHPFGAASGSRERSGQNCASCCFCQGLVDGGVTLPVSEIGALQFGGARP